MIPAQCTWRERAEQKSWRSMVQRTCQAGGIRQEKGTNCFAAGSHVANVSLPRVNLGIVSERSRPAKYWQDVDGFWSDRRNPGRTQRLPPRSANPKHTKGLLIKPLRYAGISSQRSFA